MKTKGAKSSGHQEKRSALLRACRARLAARDLPSPSMRELAAAAGVTVPTLRHYFGRREDLIVALLQELRREGEFYLARTRVTDKPFDESITSLVGALSLGLAAGLSEIHALGLREGLRHGRLGPAYLDQVLEPTVLAIEDRLEIHQARGEMRVADTRVAALALLSPLVIAHFHQNELGGVDTRRLDFETFANEHVSAFLRAYRAEKKLQ